MHPGQYLLINPIENIVFERSYKELIYHNEIFNLMELDSSAKIQIHVGGIHGEKEKSINRFVTRFESLEESLKDRIVIENDEKSYCLKDCILIH
jgi:UV DNA damage endonuclease